MFSRWAGDECLLPLNCLLVSLATRTKRTTSTFISSVWRFSYDFHETINWQRTIKRWSIHSVGVYWNVFDSKSFIFTISFADVNVLVVIFLFNCKMHLRVHCDCKWLVMAFRDNRISDEKIYKSEKNIKVPGAYISFFPPLHAVVYFNILLLCAWMALLIEFIFMINVFFFPLPLPLPLLLLLSLLLLIEILFVYSLPFY